MVILETTGSQWLMDYIQQLTIPPPPPTTLRAVKQEVTRSGLGL